MSNSIFFMKNTIIIAAAALLGGFVLFLLLRRKDDGTASGDAPNLGGQGITTKGGESGMSQSCVKPPSQFSKKWNALDIGWGNAHMGIKTELGLDSSQADKLVDDVLGFFKAIDVYPTQAGVKYFANDIQAWLAKGGSKHWDVIPGSMGCK